MRFACQSCGKAYNLPEERIAEKSNVKLKCRVCGAIVEVKRQGELVAHLLDETEDKRMARVSEAPAPLTSISPEDDDDPDGATVSISEASINDRGPLELEIPGASPTGFSPAAASALSSSAVAPAALSSGGLSSGGLSSGGLSSGGLSSAARSSGGLSSGGLSASALLPGALSSAGLSSAGLSSAGLSSAGLSSAGLSSDGFSAAGLSSAAFSPPPLTQGEAGGQRMDAPNVSLPPPPLSPSSLPPPPALRALDAAPTEAVKNGSATNGAAVSNGAAAFFPDGESAEADEGLTPELKAPVAAVGGSPVSSTLLAASALSPDLAEFPAPESEATGKDPMFKIKMLAAFATGVLIDRIISGLFQ